MQSDVLWSSVEQLCHLLLAQPNRFFGELHIQTNRVIRASVYNYRFVCLTICLHLFCHILIPLPFRAQLLFCFLFFVTINILPFPLPFHFHFNFIFGPFSVHFRSNHVSCTTLYILCIYPVIFTLSSFQSFILIFFYLFLLDLACSFFTSHSLYPTCILLVLYLHFLLSPFHSSLYLFYQFTAIACINFLMACINYVWFNSQPVLFLLVFLPKKATGLFPFSLVPFTLIRVGHNFKCLSCY